MIRHSQNETSSSQSGWGNGEICVHFMLIFISIMGGLLVSANLPLIVTLNFKLIMIKIPFSVYPFSWGQRQPIFEFKGWIVYLVGTWNLELELGINRYFLNDTISNDEQDITIVKWLVKFVWNRFYLGLRKAKREWERWWPVRAGAWRLRRRRRSGKVGRVSRCLGQHRPPGTAARLPCMTDSDPILRKVNPINVLIGIWQLTSIFISLIRFTWLRGLAIRSKNCLVKTAVSRPQVELTALMLQSKYSWNI